MSSYSLKVTAQELIDSALMALVHRNYAAAVCLAGCAEGILPPVSGGLDLSKDFKVIFAEKYSQDAKFINDEYLNYVRNGLKHPDERFDWTRVNQIEAWMMIQRAAWRFVDYFDPNEQTDLLGLFFSISTNEADSDCEVFRAEVLIRYGAGQHIRGDPAADH